MWANSVCPSPPPQTPRYLNESMSLFVFSPLKVHVGVTYHLKKFFRSKLIHLKPFQTVDFK